MSCAGKDVAQPELSYRKTAWQFLIKLSMYLLYDPIVLVPYYCLSEMKIHVHTKTCVQYLTSTSLPSVKPNGSQLGNR